jgi:DNA-binding MarR family transcriptional regulator
MTGGEEMAQDERARGTAIAHVFEELAVVNRRAAVRARSAASPLTLVEHELLDLIRSNPGITAADLARTLQLNRSTTSRQLAGLIHGSYLEIQPGPGRAQAVRLTPAGDAALAASRAAHLNGLESRLGTWPTSEIVAFAEVLGAFNGPR